jgi:hypothetical protein
VTDFEGQAGILLDLTLHTNHRPFATSEVPLRTE